MTSGPMLKLLIDGLGMFAGKATAISPRLHARARAGPGAWNPGPFGPINYRRPDGWRRRWPPPWGPPWSAGSSTGTPPTGRAGRPAGTPRTRPPSRPPAAGWSARRGRTGGRGAALWVPDRAQRLGQAELPHHLGGQVGRPGQVVRRTGRTLPQHHQLRGPATEPHRQGVVQVVLAVHVPLHQRQLLGHAESLPVWQDCYFGH